MTRSRRDFLIGSVGLGVGWGAARAIGVPEGGGECVAVSTFGARGDDSANDTEAFLEAFRTGRPVLVPPGRYRVDPMDVADLDDLVLVGQGRAVLLRESGNDRTLLRTGARARVASIAFHGRKDSFEANRAGVGLRVGDDSVVADCEAVENPGHGFRADGHRVRFLACRSSDNGGSPGPGGTGDGFYTNNHNDVAFIACFAARNARTGFVITEFEAGRAIGGRVVDCVAEGNGYNDIDCERSDQPAVRGCRAVGGIFFSGTRDAIIEANHCGMVYGDNADHAAILHNRIRAPTSVNRCLVRGRSPTVIGNSWLLDPDGEPSGNTFDITATAASPEGTVSDNSVHGAHNGFVLRNIGTARGNQWQDVSNVGSRLAGWHTGRTLRGIRTLEVDAGVVIARGEGPPVERRWNQGDRIYNVDPRPGGVVGWICTRGGEADGAARFDSFGGLS